MGALEDLAALYPDGIVIEGTPEDLLKEVQAAGQRLPEPVYKADLAALDKAIASNERAKTILAVVKFAMDLGLKFV